MRLPSLLTMAALALLPAATVRAGESPPPEAAPPFACQLSAAPVQRRSWTRRRRPAGGFLQQLPRPGGGYFLTLSRRRKDSGHFEKPTPGLRKGGLQEDGPPVSEEFASPQDGELITGPINLVLGGPVTAGARSAIPTPPDSTETRPMATSLV